MKTSEAKIWVLLGKRAGDNAQALELARRVGGKVVEKPLSFNRWVALPNWLSPSGFDTLASASRPELQPPWPALVIATGRRTARVSLAIKGASGGHTKSVQIGRPRLPLQRFDLVLATPQYSLPPDPNVVALPVPFAAAKAVDSELLENFRAAWAKLPKPWIVGVIGAARFPIQFGERDLQGFAAGLDRLAVATGGGLILIDSPRSAAGALDCLASSVRAPQWTWQRGVGANPYQAALALADQLAVTSDSVSMVSEMLGTGKPTHIFHLNHSKLAPRWKAEHGIAAVLARSGMLSPPRDVAGFMESLDRRGFAGNLNTGQGPRQQATFESALDAAVARVRALLSV